MEDLNRPFNSEIGLELERLREKYRNLTEQIDVLLLAAKPITWAGDAFTLLPSETWRKLLQLRMGL